MYLCCVMCARSYLQLKARIIANVSALDPAPGVAFHERAPDAMDTDDFADRSADVCPNASLASLAFCTPQYYYLTCSFAPVGIGTDA